MNKLTDLEICKRIAEIEGFEFDVKTLFTGGPLGVWPKYGFKEVGMSTASGSYNPLIDDALLVKLIEKYEVSISFVFCKVLINLNGVHERNFNDRLSLRRSAMLLIIDAHNGQQ